MDLIRLSEHFHVLRESADWKQFEAALKQFIRSPACAEFEAAVAPATEKLELGDYFDLLAGFVRREEPLPPGVEQHEVSIAYQQVYHYDNRPTIAISEVSEYVTIRIGDKEFPQTVSLFDFERETLQLRFGRAKLDGISRLEELTNSASPTVHRMVIANGSIDVPIQFFNVVTETDKYTGTHTTCADFYVLGHRPFSLLGSGCRMG